MFWLRLALESFIAIHLRTGEIAYDPSRHRAEDLQLFLDCARRAEEDVGEMVWLLATDSKSLAEEAMQLPEALKGHEVDLEAFWSCLGEDIAYGRLFDSFFSRGRARLSMFWTQKRCQRASRVMLLGDGVKDVA